MVRGHLPLAFQGLAVVPLFCGFDETSGTSALYSFDVVGGRYQEQDYATTGSGGQRGAGPSSRRRTVPTSTRTPALRMAVEALVAAAEEDTATGGPDVKRGIFPNVVTVTAGGLSEVGDDRLAAIAVDVLEARP